MGSRTSASRALLWVCAALSVLGIALGVLPPYRDILGAIRAPSDLLLRIAPPLVGAILHVWCARDGATPGGRAPRVVGLVDTLVGLAMWVPWLGTWIALLSPLEVIFLFVGAHASPSAGRVAYPLVSAGTFGIGTWILLRSRRP